MFDTGHLPELPTGWWQADADTWMYGQAMIGPWVRRDGDGWIGQRNALVGDRQRFDTLAEAQRYAEQPLPRAGRIHL